MSNFRIYNDALCPDLWDSAMHLDPKIRINLLRMAYDFYEKTKFPAPIMDVYLMGSGANYNWTPDSDVDVHVIIDYSKLQMPPETANKTVKTAGAQWNSEHNIFIKGHKVEMNLQNAAEQKPYVTGIYSLVNDQWIRRPSKLSVQISKPTLKFQYEMMKQYIQNCIRSRDQEKMKSAKKYLDSYRQYGLDTYGELSYENIIYKMLRAKGIVKQLKDSIIVVYDREMTVDEVGQKDVNSKLPPPSALYKGNVDFKGLGVSKPKISVDEGVGTGIPEDDRLKIKNTDGSTRRWQVRSKDAPKTPKMTDKVVIAVPHFDDPQKCNEDVDPSVPSVGGSSSTPGNNRKNLYSKDSFADNPDLKNILKIIERILDRRAIKQPFFDSEYVRDLIRDSIISEKNLNPPLQLVDQILMYFAMDFDIRENGKRLG